MPFHRWEELPGGERPGNRHFHVLATDRATVLNVEYRGPAVMGIHVHEDCDQITHLLEGEMEITVDGETRVIRPGEVAVAPAGVPHAAQVPAGKVAVALEFFAPPRKDI